MHRARTFFYVCAGLFLLALSYHLGARSATAQAGGSIQVAELADYYRGSFAAVVDRTIYRLAGGAGGPSPSVPIPGTSPVIAVNGPDPEAMLANGDCYVWSQNEWVPVGNVLGGPTPALRESFGSMKSRYRGERGAARPAPEVRGDSRARRP